MTTPTLIVPAEPVPTRYSGSDCHHRLSRVTPNVLVLEPGRSLLWAALGFVALAPIILALCISKHAETWLTVGLTLFPVFGAGGMAVAGFCYRKFGTQARFDRSTQQVIVTGLRHGAGLNYAWAEVRAVQFCDAGIKGSEGSWHAFQVNLVVGTTEPTRINLLDNGGEAKLRNLAKEIAEYLGIPLFVGSHAA